MRNVAPTPITGYQAIAGVLREEIRMGKLAVDSLLPTERELVQRFGVSRVTVRRALSALVDSGWGEAAPNRGIVARLGPSTGRNRNIAFVDHGSSLNRRLFSELSKQTLAAGYHLVHLDSSVHGVTGSLEYADNHRFAGAFIWSKKGYPDAAPLLKVVRNMPVVALDHDLQTVTTDVVTIDSFGGMRALTKHLADQGRRRIAITGFSDMLLSNHHRFSGYLMGLFDAGLQPMPRDFVWCATSALDGVDLLPLRRRLLDDDRPDAVVIANDIFVHEVSDLIESMGHSIPRDIAVAAFGDDVQRRYDQVSLTHTTFEWERIAEAAIRQMLFRIESPSAAAQTVVVPTTIVVGGSCGASPESSSPGTKRLVTKPSNGGSINEDIPSIHAH